MNGIEKAKDAAWWRWPENKQTDRVAWFVIVRRLAFYPLMTVGAAIFIAGVALSHGLKEARRAWDNL